MINRWHLRFAVLAAIDALALAGLAPDWATIGRHLAHPHAWVARAGADQAAATLAGAALWLCAAWIGAGLAVLLAGAAPGWLGAAGRRASDLLVPAMLARVLGGAAGLSITLVAPTPSIAGAATSASAPAVSTSATASTAGTAGTAVPTWPLSPVATAEPSVTPQPAHLVVAGDCLWNLATAQLGPGASQAQIAAETRSWYAANRSVIGPDPSLLHPGQRLIEPT